ncbi:MAG: hypothetical protein KDC38_12240 [Planctomycetes bacterium]|nr:hypothetical protein [Planctomycetota bacterium]
MNRFIPIVLLLMSTLACDSGELTVSASSPRPETAEEVNALFDSSASMFTLNEFETMLVAMGPEGVETLEEAERDVKAIVSSLKRQQMAHLDRDDYDSAHALADDIARYDRRRQTIRRAIAEIRKASGQDPGPLDCPDCGGSGRSGLVRCATCGGDGLIGD